MLDYKAKVLLWFTMEENGLEQKRGVQIGEDQRIVENGYEVNGDASLQVVDGYLNIGKRVVEVGLYMTIR